MTPTETLILGAYFFILSILAVYGWHRYYLVYLYMKHKGREVARPEVPAEWPEVTVQLPLYNEMYVVDRLLQAVCRMDYPRDRLEIQVLDDSTDETQEIARLAVQRYAALGFDIKYLHRDERTGFKAGALDAGLRPVKVNTVVIRGMNDDEIVDLARLTLLPDWHVRFIEVMPLGAGAEWSAKSSVPIAEIRARVEAEWGPLTAVQGEMGVGPARYYQLPGAAGTVGFISPVSDHFCHLCNRLRLTSDGRLLPCLMSDHAIDLRTPLRAGADDAELQAIFRQAIVEKPREHHLAQQPLPECALPMSTVGG